MIMMMTDENFFNKVKDLVHSDALQKMKIKNKIEQDLIRSNELEKMMTMMKTDEEFFNKVKALVH